MLVWRTKGAGPRGGQDVVVDEEFRPSQESGRASRHQRGEPRDSMFLQATMRIADGAPPLTLRVRNLSAGGMMADCTAPLEQGQSVEIDLRNVGAVAGRIAWADGQKIGIAFDKRIDPQHARKPIGSAAGGSSLVKRPESKARRPGLRLE